MTTVGGYVFVLSPTCPYRDVPHRAPSCPVPLTALAEVTRLINVVVVVITKLGVHAIATGAGEDFIRLL